jgi:cytochrome P450
VKDGLRPGFLKAKAEVFDFVDRAIAEKRASGEDRGDVLSALVHARDDDGSRMDEQELRENVWALIFAGHDTTAHAIAWALMLLAQHEGPRRRVLDEIARVLGDRTPTADDLTRLEELDRVCRESLRLFPSAPAIPRLVAQDFVVNGWTVPAGELVMCPIFLTQRLPEYFSESDEFRPDRWLDESPPKGAYMPFGIGPRWCPGMPFAMLEMKEVLAAALRRLRFELEPGQQIIAYASAPTTRPKPGIWARVTPYT